MLALSGGGVVRTQDQCANQRTDARASHQQAIGAGIAVQDMGGENRISTVYAAPSGDGESAAEAPAAQCIIATALAPARPNAEANAPEAAYMYG